MPRHKPHHTTFGDAGKAFVQWAESLYDLDGCRPLVDQLAFISDRLAVIRGDLAQPDLSRADRGRLIAAETRLLSQYRQIWREAGFSDDSRGKRGPGRPPESER